MTTNIQPGSEAAFFQRGRYTITTVTRVTKARIFIGTTEFDRETLRERGAGYDARTLVVEPAEIDKIRDRIRLANARDRLEASGIKALEFVKGRFDMYHGQYAVRHRSEAEVELLIEFAAKLEALKGDQV